jgi:hypothetical protein
MFRHAHGRWSHATALYLGDRALLVARFRWRPTSYSDNRGWDKPWAYVVVWKRGFPSAGSGVLFASRPMKRTLLRDGSNRFTVELDVPQKAAWLGPHDIEIHFRSALGADYGVYLQPRVTIRRA